MFEGTPITSPYLLHYAKSVWTCIGVVAALSQIVDGLLGALDDFQVIKKLNWLHKATGLVFNRAFSGNGYLLHVASFVLCLLAFGFC